MNTKLTYAHAKLSTATVLVWLVSLPVLAQTGPIPSPPGIVAWWPGNGDARNIVGDNPSLDGVLMNGAKADAAGLVGQAFAFDGVSSNVRLPNLVQSQSNGSVECWFKLNTWDWNVTPSGRFLWSSTLYSPNSGSSFDGINLGCHIQHTLKGELMFGVWDDNFGWHWALSGVTPQTNVWYHIAGTWGSNGICIFINGTVRGTDPYTGPAPDYLQYNQLGSSSWPNTFVDGVIDEFTLYNRALSAWEIAAIYAAGSAGKLKHGTTRFVDINNLTPVAPYTNWATAASTLQAAIDEAEAGDEIVVNNGAYAPMVVSEPVRIRSVNGPEVTVVDGQSTSRCATLTNGVVLVGFTLTNGLAYEAGGAYSGTLIQCILVRNLAEAGGGGGASQSTLIDCTLRGNKADRLGWGGGAVNCTLNNCSLTGNEAVIGGAAVWSTLNNCTLTGNSALGDNHSNGFGGGAFACTLNNCTVAGNYANGAGGGTYDCALTNSIAYHNQSPHASNCAGGALYYSCTLPLPTSGIGNITNAPLFVDAAADNFRLQSNSPCINAGANAHVPVGPDLDGNRRIVGVIADIGAYEFQSPQSTLPYVWLQHYGLPTDGSADFTDTDADHHNNWQEWQAGTDPTNSLSVLRFSNVTPTPLGVVLEWESVAGRLYWIERRTSFWEPPWWWGWWPAWADSFAPLATNIVGQAGTTTFTDTNAIGSATLFYRVGASD